MEISTPPSEAVGQYELLQRIAEGGMGTVYRARHRQSGEMVALKIIPAHIARNPVLARRFEQEYRAATALDHPNIVRAIEYGHHDGAPYLVMEFIEGESVGQRLERVGRLPETEAVSIIVQIAHALQKAHRQGLIHRDVKPDNILLTHDGQAKLTDLGLVKELDANLNLTRTNRGLGTPHFMAPEQFRNAKNADARCDIYSLAASLYMMVTGQLPFEGCNPLDAWMRKIKNDLTPPRELVPGLSPRLDWAIQRSMSADPGQRAATCRDFIEDLTGQGPPPVLPSSHPALADQTALQSALVGTGEAPRTESDQANTGLFTPSWELRRAVPPQTTGPVIHLEHSGPRAEWLKWLLFVLVAAAGAAVGFYLMPMLTYLRLL